MPAELSAGLRSADVIVTPAEGPSCIHNTNNSNNSYYHYYHHYYYLLLLVLM